MMIKTVSSAAAPKFGCCVQADVRRVVEMSNIQHFQEMCPFCRDEIKSGVVAENDSAIAIRDKYPVTDYHTLVISRRHTLDYFSLTPGERRDAEELILSLKEDILKQDPGVNGFNIGMNCGESAGQTINHAHIHLIPRRDGDIPNPRGGVRGVIPGKMAY
ncbi:HIT family protein [Thermodesulfobacteriota bacterium]